jgi:hypothetical protein
MWKVGRSRATIPAMSLAEREIDLALEELLSIALGQPDVAAEHERSRSAFARAGSADPAEAAHASRRHIEWFLLERYSPALEAVPIEGLMHQGNAFDEAQHLGEETLGALLGSRASVFEVSAVRPGEGLWVRDLAGLGEYPIEEREASHALQARDLIVGRIFASGEGAFRVSPAAGVFRNPELLEALRRDLEHAREGRRGVLRLAQSELEGMFWGPDQEALEPEVALAAARRILGEGGLSEEEVEAVLASLAEAPFDATRVLLGAGDRLGAVLERLAFHTDVDLGAARDALLQAWPVLSRAAAPAPARAEPERKRDVRTAVEAFERGRRAGRDIEQLLGELERDLELTGEDEEPAEELAPDFPGVVGAMVEEYLWELELERGSAAARAHSGLRKFSSFGEPFGVFENLGARELLLFACVWLPERGELRGAAEARQVLEALREFCRWCEESQDVPLYSAYRSSLEPLERTLPRIAEANLHRARATAKGEMYVLSEVAPEGARVVDAGGREHQVRIAAQILRHLEPGDRLRGELASGGALKILCSYPPESAVLDLGRRHTG